MSEIAGKVLLFGTLGSLCLGLLAVAAAPWFIDPLAYLAPQGTPVAADGRAEPPVLPRFDAPSVDELAAIVERPLFTATRRPAPQAQRASAAVDNRPQSGLILGRYRLTGVVVTPTLRMVFVTQPGSRKTIAVEIGKELDGWVVTEVERHAIVLKSGEREETIVIGESAEIAKSRQ